EVAPAVHVPGVRAEEAVPLERGHVLVNVARREHVRVHRHLGCLAFATEPAAVPTHVRRAGGLALAARAPLSEQRLDGAEDIGLEGGPRLVQALLGEALTPPQPRAP